MTVGERLREFGEKLYGKRGMSKFAEALEMTPQSLQNYLKTSKKPGNTFQDKLRNLGADVEYIMTGEQKNVIQSNIIMAKGHFFKVIISVNAGDPEHIFREENYSGEEIFFPFPYKERAFAVKVLGDSMENPNGKSINDGDFVFVDMDAGILNGDVVVVNLRSGRQMIKQFIQGDIDNIIFRSYNLQHPDIKVKQSEVITMFRVLGRTNFERL